MGIINPNKKTSQDYYKDLKGDTERVSQFCRNAIKEGKNHIIDLYKTENVKINGKIHNLSGKVLLKESLETVDEFKVMDKDIENELVKILAKSILYQEKGAKGAVRGYISDLANSIFTEEEDILRTKSRYYAEFRGTADFFLLHYGMLTNSNLQLPKAEAEALGRAITEYEQRKRQKPITLGRKFLRNSSKIAEEMSDFPFTKEEARWPDRADIDRKLADNYDKCLEILRTINYKCFN